MPLYTETIWSDGIRLAGASVFIRDLNDNLISLFSDMAMSISLANPVTSDLNGLISCYMTNGNRRLQIIKTGYNTGSIDIGFFPILHEDIKAQRTVNANFIIVPGDDFIWVDAPGPIQGTFPALVNVVAGNIFIVKNKSAFRVSFITPDGTLLDGLNPSARSLITAGEVISFTHDGVGWRLI